LSAENVLQNVKGKDLLIADALSRSQTTNQNRSKSEQEIEITGLVLEEQSIKRHPSEIPDETANDNILQSVIHHIYAGWTIGKRYVLVEILPFWTIKDKLLSSDGAVYRGDRIVVPTAMRKIKHTCARTSLWLPGMNSAGTVHSHMRSVQLISEKQPKRNNESSNSYNNKAR